MNVCIATKKDLPLLVQLGQEWVNEMEYKLTDDEISDELERLVDNGVTIIVRENGSLIGMMSGVVCDHVWVHQKIAHEHMFFVSPKSRGYKVASILEKTFCAWAKVKKCDAVMLSPNNFGSQRSKVIADSLERRGYSVHGYQMMRQL